MSRILSKVQSSNDGSGLFLAKNEGSVCFNGFRRQLLWGSSLLRSATGSQRAPLSDFLTHAGRSQRTLKGRAGRGGLQLFSRQSRTDSQDVSVTIYFFSMELQHFFINLKWSDINTVQAVSICMCDKVLNWCEWRVSPWSSISMESAF